MTRHTIVRERVGGAVLLAATARRTLAALPGLSPLELLYLINVQLRPDERVSADALAVALRRLYAPVHIVRPARPRGRPRSA